MYVDVGINTTSGEEEYLLSPLLVFSTTGTEPIVFSIRFCSVLPVSLFKCSFHVEEEIFNPLINNLGLRFQPFKMQT